MLQLSQQQKGFQWSQLADPTHIRTILGILPKYQAVNQLLIESDNTALQAGIYKADQQTLRILNRVILLMRKQNIEELNATINNSQQFIGQKKYLSLSNKC